MVLSGLPAETYPKSESPLVSVVCQGHLVIREMIDGTREDTTVSVQIEEIKCVIRALPFVTKLSPVRAHKGRGAGWGVSLRCSACKEQL